MMAASPARSKSGWDGKLRMGEINGDDNDSSDADENGEHANGQTPHPDQRQAVVQQGEAVEGEQIEADEDLVAEYDDDTEDIELSHCRISSLQKLGLDRFSKLLRLCLRQNQVVDLELPAALGKTLEELDLYDNLIKDISGLDDFTKLTSLDFSFNKIKRIRRVNHLMQLKDLYFVQNRISIIEGLEGLSNLRNLELGGNRIRVR